MRRHEPLRFFWLVSLGLLLIYAWTLTERVTVTVNVADGHCTAILYGRSSAIDCPGLGGGALLSYAEREGTFQLAARIIPQAAWQRLEFASGGQLLPPTTPLPSRFEITGRLWRPYQPAGLVLQRQGEASGWAFVIDGPQRRGAWWTWQDGELGRPLQGIPLDRPFAAQSQAFARQLLRGWWGAVVLVAAAFGLKGIGGMVKLGDKGKVGAPIALPGSGFNDYRFTIRNLPRQGFPRSLIFLIPILFTFTISTHVANHILEREPHIQDSVTYLFQAQTLARGRLAAPAPPLAAAEATPHFAQEFLLVRGDRWFGKYTPGYPALLALGVLARAHWLLNPLLAALTVALAMPLAKIFSPSRRRPTATHGRPAKPSDTDTLNTDLPDTLPLQTIDLLPLLLALSPFFLIMSGSLMAHTAELWWAMLFMVAWAQAWRQGRRRWAVAAGIAFGLLFLTRPYTAAIVGLAYGLALPLFLRSPAAQHPRCSAGHLTRATVPLLLLAAAPFLLALPAYQAAVTGDPLTDPRLLYWPYDRVGFGPGSGEPQNTFTYAPTAADPAIQWHTDPNQPPRGHTPARGLYNLGVNLDALEHALFGWPALFSLSFVWLAFLLRRPRAVDWLMLLVLAAVTGGHVVYWASGVAYGPRYLFAALPALAFLTARGIAALAGVVGRGPITLLVGGLAVFGLFTLPGRLASYRDYNFVDPALRAAVADAVERPALVFVEAGTADWWEYGSFFSGNTPWLDGPVVYARDLGAAENTRLSQTFPGRAVYLWRDGQLHQQPDASGKPPE